MSTTWVLRRMRVPLSFSRSMTGGFKELVFLFIPLAAVAFSNCAYLVIEKLFLVHLSPIDLEAAINAAYAWQIFQGFCIALAMMAQVYVGRCYGAKDFKAIGVGIWQFIWFSLLSTFLTLPLGILYGHYYFRNTEIESVVWPYYSFLLAITFLFPLTIALTSFYIGQGKTRLVFWATLISQVAKVGIASILILGWRDWIAPMGLIGGAMSTLIAQGGLCVVLFVVFLSSKNREECQTGNWHWRPSFCWECLYPGVMRAFGRVITFACWASIAYLMSSRGGDYLLILSVGGTLFLVFQFLSEALYQAQVTVVSNILGSGHYDDLKRAYYSAFLLVTLMITIVGLPLLIAPLSIFGYLFPGVVLSEVTIKNVFFGVWLCCAFFSYSFIPIGHVFAFKDAHFFLFMGAFNWIN
jgi:MATE family multidrug resistance protein